MGAPRLGLLGAPEDPMHKGVSTSRAVKVILLFIISFNASILYSYFVQMRTVTYSYIYCTVLQPCIVYTRTYCLVYTVHVP